MAKFYHKSKLNNKEQEELLIDLCDAISSIHNSREAAQFLKDLLSSQEAEMLAKRIKIAELLLKDWGYQEIKNILKVGDCTIARVSEWLKITGDGYRLIIERLKEKRERRKIKPKDKMSEIGDLKRSQPLLFWPELLIENLIKNNKTKDKKKIVEALVEIRKKPGLYRKIQKELRGR
jgi:TrpR-related protein YerC/YecD